ncbi:hypothetical protein HanPI659440_Chr15g0618031 [Helianthus annuus]|nr:hypothetical protein HanPI659440_Chr15g0618031 [Helianthus annuus]
MLTLNIHLIYYLVVLEFQYSFFQIFTHVCMFLNHDILFFFVFIFCLTVNIAFYPILFITVTGLEFQYSSFQIFTHVFPQTTSATTDVSVKEENREETHHPKDVTIKQEEIKVITEDADLDDDKWWCDNIDDILEIPLKKMTSLRCLSRMTAKLISS